jgi:CHAT domain-containing protein
MQGSQTYVTRQTKLVTVAAEQSQDSTLPLLPYVTREVQGIVELSAIAGVHAHSVAESAASEHVVASLQSARIVHIACHGVQHGAEPHLSHFCLGSGNLSISDLMKADFKDAFLAFLSACETAQGNQKHADEVVHLAATMLFVGYKSVVATMW